MEQKIVFHVGPNIDLKTKAKSGTLSFGVNYAIIQPEKEPSILISNIKHIKMFRLHGLGRMIKIELDSETIFLTVIRLNILNYFVLINFLKTGEVYKFLRDNACA